MLILFIVIGRINFVRKAKNRREDVSFFKLMTSVRLDKMTRNDQFERINDCEEGLTLRRIEEDGEQDH
jgi:hypothetical protein